MCTMAEKPLDQIERLLRTAGLEGGRDWATPQDAYNQARGLFLERGYCDLGVGDFVSNPYQFPLFDAVRRNDFETMSRLVRRRVVASLTSYPPRMPYVASCIKTILDQSHPADKVLLWLAREQFPLGREDFPDDLNSLIDSGRVELRWCDDDLKSHKKYFYALQEYSDDVVVLFDDDLRYGSRSIERLWGTYLQHPDAVSALRTHVILFDENGCFLPYSEWVMTFGSCPFVPVMRLLCTTGAGSLYPPGVLPAETFDRETIVDSCLHSDDLWLKAMEVMAGTPVVVSAIDQAISYCEGSQSVALWSGNSAGGNDRQLALISKHLNSRFGDRCLERRVLGDDSEAVFGEFLIAAMEHGKQQGLIRAAKAELSKERARAAALQKDKLLLRAQLDKLEVENGVLRLSFSNRLISFAKRSLRSLFG